MSPKIDLPLLEHTVYYAYEINLGGAAIGSFEKFSERSTRTVERIRNVFFSSGAKVVDMAWGGTDITLELTHVELYTKPLIGVLGFATSLEQWNALVDINEVLNIPSGKYNAVTYSTRVLTFHKCAPSDYSKDIDIGTARVLEHMTFQASYVTATVTS